MSDNFSIGFISTFDVAEINTISEVDVSLSTVIELNVLSHKLAVNFFKISYEILTSVIMNASIVAIFGAIIPDPLAIPTTETNLFSNLNFLYLILG